MKLIAVYGTLRKGGYNYDRFIRYGHNFEYIETTNLNNFDIYDLGYYPCACRSKDNGSIVIDLFRVSDETFNSLNQMELGAGYTVHEVDTQHGKATIWIYTRVPTDGFIQGGDYIKYIQKR